MNPIQSRLLQEDLYSIPIDAFFKSAFSVDCIIFGYHEKELKVLLIQRGIEPFEDFWALPGDLVYPNEDLDAAAVRILKDLTTLIDIPIKQVQTFGKVDRHPLGRVITISYLALVEQADLTPYASSWAKTTKWHSLNDIPNLAFDHKEILNAAIDELRNRIHNENIWSKVLPDKFTLTQFQEVFETILNREFDKGNFRKKIVKYKFLKKLEEAQTNVSHRPSLYYTFDENKFNEMKANGFSFDF